MNINYVIKISTLTTFQQLFSLESKTKSDFKETYKGRLVTRIEDTKELEEFVPLVLFQ